jgi:hypothetical protein
MMPAVGYAEEEYRRYVDRMPGAREASLTDPTYASQMHFIRRMLATTELALENERVPDEVRQRVIRTVLFGSPDPEEGIRRQEQHRAMVAQLRNAPITVHQVPDMAPGVAAVVASPVNADELLPGETYAQALTRLGRAVTIRE